MVTTLLELFLEDVHILKMKEEGTLEELWTKYSDELADTDHCEPDQEEDTTSSVSFDQLRGIFRIGGCFLGVPFVLSLIAFCWRRSLKREGGGMPPLHYPDVQRMVANNFQIKEVEV